jgi:hypothetical protein
MLHFLKYHTKVGTLFGLPASVRLEVARDQNGLTADDPGIDRVIEECVGWLARAQDNSRSADGGVARHYGLQDGWATSYPETTGYIIPTLLDYADVHQDAVGLEARRRAERMLDWLVTIQFPAGGFQGGTIGETPVVPVTFNTGQILLGLVCGVRRFGDRYREPMQLAADWLVQTQDVDGCWRKHPSPFTKPGEKAYETHVAWGLLEAARVEGSLGRRYADAALANVTWALRWQARNGWFRRCCVSDEHGPLSHTIGYVLRGIVEAYVFTRDLALLDAAGRTADGLLTAIRPDGFLPGRLGSDWRGKVSWSCLTGTAQIACCWLLLYEQTGRKDYFSAACAANSYLRRSIKVAGPPETRGAVKGSFPVDGDYCRYQFPNWACKFVIDANFHERRLATGAQRLDDDRRTVFARS